MTLAAGPEDSELPVAVIIGLFEALSYGEMLDDAAVAAALESALLHLAPKLDLDLASGGRYPGLYQLMAHRSPEIRSQVSRYRASSKTRTSAIWCGGTATCVSSQNAWSTTVSSHNEVTRGLPGRAVSQIPCVLHRMTELCKQGPGRAAQKAANKEVLCTPSCPDGCR